MKVINIQKADYCDSDFILDATISVTFESGNVVDVQLAGGDHKQSLNCLLFLNGKEWGYDQEGEELINVAIEAAEAYALEEYEKQYEVIDLDFNCSINNTTQYIITDKNSGQAHIISRDHYNDDYSPRVSILKTFCDKDEAIEYVESFETGEHHDFSGPQAMLDDIERENRA